MYRAPSALSYPVRPIAAVPYVIPAAVPSSFSPMFSEAGMCRVYVGFGASHDAEVRQHDAACRQEVAKLALVSLLSLVALDHKRKLGTRV
jgi:hypothetical protein